MTKPIKIRKTSMDRLAGEAGRNGFELSRAARNTLSDDARLARPGEKRGTHIVVSVDEYDDLVDRAALRAADSPGVMDDALPLDIVQKLEAGENPVRVFRKWRGMTAAGLADKAGTSQSFISEIETGKKAASVDLVKRLAAALGVDAAELID